MSAKDIILAASGNAVAPQSDYQISRSLRFNSADSAYLNRTPASAGNRKTWTWSGWVKINSFTSLYQNLFSVSDGSSGFTGIRFYENSTFKNELQIFEYTGSSFYYNLTTSQVFRDVSSWYHIVVALDTTQATDSNRIKLYVNGVQVTSFQGSTTWPSLNWDGYVNNTNVHTIGSSRTISPSNHFDIFSGYLTEIHFVDGQALTADSFGEVDSVTGVWKPIAYAGTYGTNGFHLDFSDNSSTTALGYDAAGSNDWTPNNFSVTAGAGNDSLVDTPTQYGDDTGSGGEVRGNYCTLNPLSNTSGTWSNGNLRYVGPTNWNRSNGTLSVSTGKWYWEVTLGNAPYFPPTSNTSWNAFGFGPPTVFASTTAPAVALDALVLADNGHFNNFSGSYTSVGTGFSSGDVLSIAVDLDANTFTFRRNNTSVATGTIGGTVGRELVPIIISYDGNYGVMDCNFGQRPFAYTAPSGFKALVTTNLPEPTVVQGNDYFNTVLYTGNGSTQAITGYGFSPDFIWIKSRSSGALGHVIQDQVRGVNRTVFTSSTSAETGTAINYLVSFDSDGVTVDGTTYNPTNQNGGTYVGWGWNAGGSSSTNTDGTITSTVMANPTAGISIVSWTYGGAAATIGHGLNAVPKMMILKGRTGTYNWDVYHTSVGATARLLLNSTSEKQVIQGPFNNTEPTSTVFSQGPSWYASNTPMIGYIFTDVPGFSAFGSYTGNSSTNGPFIYTGFRPAFVIVKNASANSISSYGSWKIVDSARHSYNGGNPPTLYANASYAEGARGNGGGDGYSEHFDFLSNGFKIGGPSSYGIEENEGGVTYIYAAFAENPFKYSLAR